MVHKAVDNVLERLNRLISIKRAISLFAVVTAGQLRAARALLGWTQRDLAKGAYLSLGTIKALESGSSTRTASLQAAIATLQAAGIVFVAAGDTRPGGPGVRLKG
jgi:DNA-binding XRE family transcriptional regulator